MNIDRLRQLGGVQKKHSDDVRGSIDDLAHVLLSEFGDALGTVDVDSIKRSLENMNAATLRSKAERLEQVLSIMIRHILADNPDV